MDGDDMKRRLNKKAIFLLGGVILTICLGIGGYNFYKYQNSNSYKLGKLGYSKEEIKLIIEKNTLIDVALKEYNLNFAKFLTNKYFMRNRFERYLAYYNEHKDTDTNTIVGIVNANADKKFYMDTKTSFGDDYLILVNKYNGLESSFVPNDLANISIQYAYSGHKIREEVNAQYTTMAKDAKNEGLVLIVNSSYRSYESQEVTYNSFKRSKGEIEADLKAARPGYSEHQTGLALDITTRLSEDEEFVNTEEFTWLKENAHKYGFILRYPEGKENITGYSYEPWHYRYVGIDVATKIYNENITFDEYYAYYIENGVK